MAFNDKVRQLKMTMISILMEMAFSMMKNAQIRSPAKIPMAMVSPTILILIQIMMEFQMQLNGAIIQKIHKILMEMEFQTIAILIQITMVHLIFAKLEVRTEMVME
ncbi:MAG: hypothetical protein KDD60_03300 [Bdellovibrionales bacterium]|nr:hypothetical protein [Bdellovibrionales bacterium]